MAEAKYALADRFDEAKGEYSGLRLGRLVEVDLKFAATSPKRGSPRQRKPSRQAPEP